MLGLSFFIFASIFILIVLVFIGRIWMLQVKDGDFYFTKSVISNKNKSSSCLVCKKMKETNKNLLGTAERLIEEYNKNFFKKPEKLSYDLIDIENIYYRWLYKN
jgi:hypothetical protein